MAEKRAWNVGLNAKGLEASVSEEQARAMCTTPGRTSMFIIEAHHGPFLTNEDGSIKMNLIIDQVELIPTAQEDRVRRFKRALYLSRPDQYGQEAFDGATGDGEPKVKDAAEQLDAVVEVGADGEVAGVWSGDGEDPDETGKPWPGDPEFVSPDLEVVK